MSSAAALTHAARSRRSLPILSSLDDVRIAAPCDADWSEMKPLTDDDGARARRCGACNLNVYDLTSMTRSDALSLLQRHEGQVCVRFHRRQDGTVMTSDCPVGVATLVARARIRAAAGIALAFTALIGVVVAFVGRGAAQSLTDVKRSLVHHVEPPMMGGPPPPPPTPACPGPPLAPNNAQGVTADR